MDRPEPRTPREALLMILAELGVPGEDTPAPVGNCVAIANEGLKRTALETFDENDRLKEYLANMHGALKWMESRHEDGDCDLPPEVLSTVRASMVLPPDIEAAVEMRRHRGA